MPGFSDSLRNACHFLYVSSFPPLWRSSGAWAALQLLFWLVVWLPFFIFPEILGISSSQLTNSYFSEGWVYNHQADHFHWRVMIPSIPGLVSLCFTSQVPEFWEWEKLHGPHGIRLPSNWHHHGTSLYMKYYEIYVFNQCLWPFSRVSC